MNPALTLEEVEEHLRPAGNVTLLDQDGSPPPAAGMGATETEEGDSEGERPSSVTFKGEPASGR